MSTHLITGFANKEHVKSADMASYNASIMGNGEFVLERGEQLRVQVVSNNKVRIYDGDIMMQGRHIMIDRGTYEEMTHENGAQGYKRIDLIVMTYEKDNITGIENAKVEVIKGTPTAGTPVVPGFATGDILDAGALKNQMPLYKVPFDGIAIGTPVKMFKIVPTMETRENEILENLQNQFNTLNANTSKNFSTLSTNITNQFAELESEIEEDINCEYGVIKRYYPMYKDASKGGEPILGSLLPLTNGQLVIVKENAGGYYGSGLSKYVEELTVGIYRINNPSSALTDDYNNTYYTFETYTRVGDYTECVAKKVSILEERVKYIDASFSERVASNVYEDGYINSQNSFTPAQIIAIQRTLTYTNGVADLDISDMGIQVIFPLNVNVVGSSNTYGVIATTINSGKGLRATLNNTSYNGALPTTFLVLCLT